MLKFWFIIVACIVCCARLQAQPKNIRAIKVNTAPHIDGILDEDIWKDAPAATDFITRSPVYGKHASSKAEVKVLYDNTSIYIGAFIHENPKNIHRQYTARDEERKSDIDYFSVFLDTYHDRQNAFQFLVTSRNVQTDARVSPQTQTESGIYGDISWDAVWDSRVSINNEGWVVEIKIPYFSIRFSKEVEQDWGIQFLHFSANHNEISFWNPVDPNVSGFANQFGDLSGLHDLVPPLRLSFSPYISGGYRGTPTIASGYTNEWLHSGGMDVKYGINESFTLDATLIPDFGQVVSDNVVNNISPFEIQFRENRPFFTEGTELFNKSQIFYSRRVGDVPGRYAEINEEVTSGALREYQIEKNPSVTRLYNAIKFSGRTRNNLGIGVFNAVAQATHAKLRNNITGKDTSIQTEPLTNYNVIVIDQALKNRSFITITNTNVLRNGHERDANVTAVDIALYGRKNRFGMILSPRYSKIFDPNNGYDGFSNYLEVGKVSGKFRYSLINQLKSAQYDPNDLGFIYSPNEFSTKLSTGYYIFDATPVFLNQRYNLAITYSNLYNQFEFQKATIEASGYWIFRNFWDVTLRSEVQPVWYNDFFELRTPESILQTPRMKLRRAPNYFVSMAGSSDTRKKLSINWELGFAESPLPDDPYYSGEFGFLYRFGDRFSLGLDLMRRQDFGQFGYSSLRDQNTKEPILARREYLDFTTVFSGTYHFTSRMNINFRARHFWNRIQNSNFYDVLPDGNWTERYDLDPGNYNTNYNAFNLDVFYAWDFRPGSRIVVGWKNWLGTDYEFSINELNFPKYIDNAKQVFSTPHGDEITVRFIYFLNYNQFLRKK